MTDIVVAETVELEQLNKSRAERVNELQGMIYSSAQNMVEYAIEIGQILIEVKASLEHGDFIPWVMANCDFNRMQAWRYMKLAEANVSHAIHFEGVTSIREALKLLEPPKEPKQLPTRVDSMGTRYEPAQVRYTADGEEEYVDGEYEDIDKRVAKAAEVPVRETLVEDNDIEDAIEAFKLIGDALFKITNRARNKKIREQFLHNALGMLHEIIRRAEIAIVEVEKRISELNAEGI
jgi:hypothetical protein